MDEKEYIILKAVIEKLDSQGQPLGSKEVMSILAETTGKTIVEQKVFPVLEDLQSRHLIGVRFAYDGLTITDAQIVSVTPEGRKCVSDTSDPKSKLFSLRNILWTCGIASIFIGYLNGWFDFVGHLGCESPAVKSQKSEEQETKFAEQQKTACGLYSYFSQVLFDLNNGKKDIRAERMQSYLTSQNYMDPAIHIQIGNLNTSIDGRNFVAAKAQAKEIVEKLETIYRCELSDIQLGVDKKHGAVSADTEIVRSK